MNRIQRCALFTLLLAAVGIPAAQAQNSFAEDTTRNAPPAQRAPGQAQRPPQQYPAQQYPQAPGNAQPWQNQPAQPPPGQPWQGQPPPWQAPGGPQNPPPQPGWQPPGPQGPQYPQPGGGYPPGAPQQPGPPYSNLPPQGPGAPMPPGMNPGGGVPPMAGPGGQPGQPNPQFAQVEQMEAEEFGVPPTEELRNDRFHAPTPTRIPGGLVVTTEALNGLYTNNQGQFIVFDVLGGPQGLPGAQNARPAGAGGSFNDQTQRDFGNYLQSVTGGNKQVPLVFYCQNAHCWLSYNAALRAIKMGYTQVLWYRGGIEAWQQAGLPTFGAGGY